MHGHIDVKHRIDFSVNFYFRVFFSTNIGKKINRQYAQTDLWTACTTVWLLTRESIIHQRKNIYLCLQSIMWNMSTHIHWFSLWFIRLPSKNGSLAVWLINNVLSIIAWLVNDQISMVVWLVIDDMSMVVHLVHDKLSMVVWLVNDDLSITVRLVPDTLSIVVWLFPHDLSTVISSVHDELSVVLWLVANELEMV